MLDNMGSDRHQSQAGLSQRRIYAYDAALVVEAVEKGGQVIAVTGNALGSVVGGSLLHFLRIGLDLLDKVNLAFVREQFKIHAVREFQPRFLCLTEDAADAGMSILDVVHA